MGMRREDSVLVALGELRRMEEERRREEEDLERQKEETLRLARDAEALRAADEEARRRRLDEEARRRKAEDEARLEREEGIRVQEAAAGAEAEARARADQELRLHLAAIRARHGRRNRWLPVAVGATLLVGMAAWLVHSKTRQAKMASALAERSVLDAQRAGSERDRLRQLLQQSEKRLEALREERGAKTSEDRAGPKGEPKRKPPRPQTGSEPSLKRPDITIDLDSENPIGGLDPG